MCIRDRGLAGGSNGKVGRNAIRRQCGDIEELPGRIQIKCKKGEAIIIQTPSGGGYGATGVANSVSGLTENLPRSLGD